jgi:hypothetical protein
MVNQTPKAVVKVETGVYYRPRTVLDVICLLFRVLSSSDRVSLWGVKWFSDDYLPKDVSDMIIEHFRLGPVPGFLDALRANRPFSASPHTCNNSYAVMWGGFPYEPSYSEDDYPLSPWERVKVCRDLGWLPDHGPHHLVAVPTSTGIKIVYISQDERFHPRARNPETVLVLEARALAQKNRQAALVSSYSKWKGE